MTISELIATKNQAAIEINNRRIAAFRGPLIAVLTAHAFREVFTYGFHPFKDLYRPVNKGIQTVFLQFWYRPGVLVMIETFSMDEDAVNNRIMVYCRALPKMGLTREEATFFQIREPNSGWFRNMSLKTFPIQKLNFLSQQCTFDKVLSPPNLDLSPCTHLVKSEKEKQQITAEIVDQMPYELKNFLNWKGLAKQ